MLKAIGNAKEAQSSSQLSVVLYLLLVDSLESLDFLLGFGNLLSILGHSLTYSGCKPIGCGADGGIECRVEGKDCLSQCRRDHRVVIPCKVNEAGNGPMVAGQGVLLVVSDKGEWEGGSCWRWRDFHKGDAVMLVWRGGDTWHVQWWAAAFIAGVGGVGHLAMVRAAVVMAETAVFKAVSMCVMAERTEANMGIFTGYLAQAKLDEFVWWVDGKVVKEGPKREAGNFYRCQSCCLGVDGGSFGAVAAAAAAISATAAVAVLPLPDVFRWASLRSQVGWEE
jgi:hypothetical protein